MAREYGSVNCALVEDAADPYRRLLEHRRRRVNSIIFTVVGNFAHFIRAAYRQAYQRCVLDGECLEWNLVVTASHRAS